MGETLCKDGGLDALNNEMDLLAVLLNVLEREQGMIDKEDEDCLTGEQDDKLMRMAEDIVESAWAKNNEADAGNGGCLFRLHSEGMRGILERCRDEKNPHLTKRVILTLCRKCAPRTIPAQWLTNSFEALNTNGEETGIIVLPKVDGPQTVRRVKTQDGEERELVRKTAHEWWDQLNGEMRGFYYVREEELRGYCVKNIVYDPGVDARRKNSIRVGAAPLWSGEVAELLSWRTVVEKDNHGIDIGLFDQVQLVDAQRMNRTVHDSYLTACENGVNILVYPEMCGSAELYEVAEDGYNPMLAALNEETQGAGELSLIIAPSRWENNSNRVHIYNRQGKLLMCQHKMHRFCLKNQWKERLENQPKEIGLLHIPGWGRMATMICIDALYPQQRDVLVRNLRADMLMIPSFSFGSTNFESMLSSGIEFGCTAVWLNCCAAAQKGQQSTTDFYVGAACGPSLSDGGPQGVRMQANCKGVCCNGCLFVLDIPLNCAGELPHRDAGIICRHVWKDSG